ncbi:MAG: hypothetical protein ACD_20C00157G0010 [uncultured bacterium]|nr:MAG: hypothetical protein ACD_20C00157G0010 [uncultured bacterium]HBH18089.1 hypothetical protein [Cyanobacteria bacterium UBA9579]
MFVSNVLANPVNLKTLKTRFYDEFSNFTLVLRDDIWKRGTLILRGGKYLTEDVVDKLLKFGVNEVNIHLDEEDYEEEEHKAVEELKRNFIETQNILLIDRDFDDVGYIVKNLVNTGFNKAKIYASKDIRVINKYLEDKIPDYLFINYDSGVEVYIKAIREVEILRNTHIFLTASIDSELSIKELENIADSLDTKLLLKPVIAGHLRNLVNQTIDLDFCKLLRNKNNENAYKYSIM